MRFVIRQKILSLGDSFIIHDENNNPMYKVVGKIFALGDQLTIYDMYNKEQVYIQQKIFKLLPEYHLFMQGRCMAVIKKEFTFFKPKFNIKSEFGDYTVEGNIFGYSFGVFKNGREVASVQKAFFAFRDTYTVEIYSKEEEPLLLAVCIVIDQVLHDGNHNKH